jgi:hypothetical protein
MGCDYALSTELGATVAAATAGSPLEYAFDHPRQRLDPMLRPCATRVDRPAWRAPGGRPFNRSGRALALCSLRRFDALRVGPRPWGLLVFAHVSRYRRDMPVVVPSRESAPLPIGPGIPMQVVVPSVSRAAVLQGTALTTFVEIPSGPTLSKPGPGYTSGTGPPNALSGASGP